MRKKYTNVAIPVELANQIDKIIENSKLAYTSRAQFTLEAIREKIIKENKF